MLQDILKIITRDGYISRTQIAEELKVDLNIIDEGISQLLRMGYLEEERTGENCSTFCGNCPFAKNCNKEIVKTFKLSEKASNI